MTDFSIGETDFLLDGKPFRVLAGALHYFRVHPDQWRDRIRKARQMGLNTIETYVPWNEHARAEGDFDLAGRLDLGRFLDDIQAEGMHAIVRPGPYICAEWDNGGLPAWLFHDTEVGVRRDEPKFLAAVQTFLDHLAPVLTPRQIDRGGPILLVQIENEYGAYGDDPVYLQKLVDMNRQIGLTVPFITVDQPTDEMLLNGSLPELHKTGSFGSRAKERLATLREHQPTGPLMCSEFWNGWFDYWGSHHHIGNVPTVSAELDELLGQGASVNLYMFHGGASFGFTSGANDKGSYQATVTSYDYDAPLDEAGEPTEKYWAFRDVISRYAPVPDDVPTPSPRPDPLELTFTRTLALTDALPFITSWSTHEALPSMDFLGHYRGFALYTTPISTTEATVLSFDRIRDRVQVFVDGSPIGVLARDHHEKSLVIPGPLSGTLELLVEDQGRVNYGPLIGEPKGLIGEARLDDTLLSGWNVSPLQVENIDPVTALLRGQSGRASTSPFGGPSFALATFDLPEHEREPLREDISWLADRYLHTRGLTKGIAFVNGFFLGRYWSRGPQHTLYVPGPVLKATGNELIVFEQHGAEPTVSLVGSTDLGHTEL